MSERCSVGCAKAHDRQPVPGGGTGLTTQPIAERAHAGRFLAGHDQHGCERDAALGYRGLRELVRHRAVEPHGFGVD